MQCYHRKERMSDDSEDLEGNDLDEDFTVTYQELCKAAVDLLVNIGIISSIRVRWPEEAQVNWVRELQNMIERVNDDIRVAQEFASSFD